MSERSDLILDETATQLDRILNALVPPGPPPYDPMQDPEETVFVMRDGSKKVLTNVKQMYDIDPDAENSSDYLLYFDGSESFADPSTYGDIVRLKFGNWRDKTFTCYPYNCSGFSIMAPRTYADAYSYCEYPNLEWIRFEDLGPTWIPPYHNFYTGDQPGKWVWDDGEAIVLNNLTHLTAIEFPISAFCSISIQGDSNLTEINHPIGEIFGPASAPIEGCDKLSAINFPSSGYVKTKDWENDWPQGLPSTVLSVTIPENLSFDFGNYTFANQKDIYFEGRTIDEVKALSGYIDENHRSMFGDVDDEPSEYGDPNPKMTLHCSDGDISLYVVP